MTKSELIDRIAEKQTQLAYRDVELAVKTVLEHMAECLASGDRIEIRGFGSFSLHYRPGRVGRNPKTGAPVSLPAKYVPHFNRARNCVNAWIRVPAAVKWPNRYRLEGIAAPYRDCRSSTAPPVRDHHGLNGVMRCLRRDPDSW